MRCQGIVSRSCVIKRASSLGIFNSVRTTGKNIYTVVLILLITFRSDSTDWFDERFQYGRRSKVSLLMRINVSGVWDKFKWYPWEAPFNPKYTVRSEPQPYKVLSVGWVARLRAGRPAQKSTPKSSQTKRFNLRLIAIVQFIRSLDTALLTQRIQELTPNMFSQIGREQTLYIRHNPRFFNHFSLLSRKAQNNVFRTSNFIIKTPADLWKFYINLSGTIFHHYVLKGDRNNISNVPEVMDFNGMFLNNLENKSNACMEMIILPHILGQQAHALELISYESKSAFFSDFYHEVNDWLTKHCFNENLDIMVQAIATLVKFALYSFVGKYHHAAVQLNGVIVKTVLLLRIQSTENVKDYLPILTFHLDYFSQVAIILNHYKMAESLVNYIKRSLALTFCEEVKEMNFPHRYIHIYFNSKINRYCLYHSLFQY